MNNGIVSRVCFLAALAVATNGLAADIDAGKAKANVICAACHGANGVSVANHIPNLAAQRDAYLATQLRAFKDGSRKSEIMSVIAPQLSDAEIANVAAYFSSLPGAAGAAKSAFLPNVAKTNVTLPQDYPAGFRRYHALNLAESKQVKVYYANEKAIAAAVAGKTLPDGAMIVVQIHAAKLDADKKPVIGSDGYFIPEKIMAYTTMARDAGWGKDIPDLIRNENWNYAIFSAEKQVRITINHAECLACHVPAAKDSYMFTLKELAALRK